MKHRSIIFLSLSIIIVTAVFIVGFVFAKNQYQAPPVTSQTVLRTMQNEGFFVTQELILEETVSIDNRSGNALKDFFVSENIEAEADLRIAVGIDTTQISAENIEVTDKEIYLTLPAPTIFSTEVLGEVDIDSERGIITKITSGEEDYNGLVATLKEQARASITDEKIAPVITNGAEESVTRFIRLIAPRYTPIIQFNTST